MKKNKILSARSADKDLVYIVGNVGWKRAEHKT